MHNLDIIMNNYFLRVFASLISIIIGLFLLMCYIHRDKKNTWGQIYLSLYESLNQIAKLGKSEKMDRSLYDKAWFLLAICCLIMSIIAIFFSFG